ncbi:PREDICTED: uncharacterized protein LOC109350630 [Lupinus angustifolius]|uniref:uncharacterized protein LOC109350630 n=1 Tax=Lupinus angustifolius TaxID=3871 RepID=UPI00092F2700|nr:PREDICTED: uncharacterized protein LOC109350630 [Lupinus angustifolius]
MEENDKVGDYFTKVLTITNQIKGCEELVSDLMIIEKIMRSLPQKFDFIVIVIKESKYVSRLQVEELQSSLEAHEMRLLERNLIKNYDQALKITHFRDEEIKRNKRWKGKKGKSDIDCDKGKKNNHEKEAFTAQEELEEEPLILMVTNYVEHIYESWYLDLGCSNHMTSQKEWLSYFDPSRKSKVKFVDDNTLRVEGTSDV